MKPKGWHYRMVVMVICLAVSSNQGAAQDTTLADSGKRDLRQSVFLELGGRAMVYSLNYEIQPFKKLERGRISIGVGYGYYKLVVPVNYYHKFYEPTPNVQIYGGIGVTNVFNFQPYPRTKEGRREFKILAERTGNIGDYSPPFSLGVYGTLNVRFLLPQSFYFTVSYTPGIYTLLAPHSSRWIPLWGGIKLGYDI